MWPDDKDIFEKYYKHHDYKNYDKYDKYDKYNYNEIKELYPYKDGLIRKDKDYLKDYEAIRDLLGKSFDSDSIAVKMNGDMIVIDGVEIEATDFETIGEAVYKALAKKMLSK